MWFSFVFLHFPGNQIEGGLYSRVLYNFGMLLLEILNSMVSLWTAVGTVANLDYSYCWSLLSGNVFLCKNNFSLDAGKSGQVPLVYFFSATNSSHSGTWISTMSKLPRCQMVVQLLLWLSWELLVGLVCMELLIVCTMFREVIRPLCLIA